MQKYINEYVNTLSSQLIRLMCDRGRGQSTYPAKLFCLVKNCKTLT